MKRGTGAVHLADSEFGSEWKEVDAAYRASRREVGERGWAADLTNKCRASLVDAVSWGMQAGWKMDDSSCNSADIELLRDHGLSDDDKRVSSGAAHVIIKTSKLRRLPSKPLGEAITLLASRGEEWTAHITKPTEEVEGFRAGID